MKDLFIKIAGKLYSKAKSNTYIKKLYYAAANRNYFSSFQEHEKMLADKIRVDTYYTALQKYISKGDVVIDLGTGTGILSFMASKKSPSKIFAIEHSDIIDSARKAAVHNNISCIEFVNINSREFNTDIKADVLIHEQIGAYLFDENMIDNILDLRDRVLKKGGKIIPGKFEFFVEPVELKKDHRIPFIWEQQIHGIKFDCFSDLKNDSGANYGIILIRPESVEKFVSESERLIYFDLEKTERDSIPLKYNFTRKINQDCEINGLIIFFNIIFDETIKISTSPFLSDTHWNIPLLRTESFAAKKDDLIEISFEMKDISDAESYKWSCRKV
ncbi:MAG: 50S ribosomal protein L11 methyltransferase [Ignavibacteria bacterium]|nr:50S ribosomal protein L11 methyltransferase [Ignavibacteria bacterium]